MPASRTLLARALVGSPIRRPLGGCLFWAAMLVLLGVAFLGHIALWIAAPLAAAGVFAGTALVATLTSLPALALLWALDRRERESVWLVGGALLWGAVVSTGLAGILNSLGFSLIARRFLVVGDLERDELAQVLGAALVAPPVEEATKGLALLVLFWFLRAEFDNLRDGLIYGALVGLGFNIAETALYVMNGYLETGTPPLAAQLAARFVFLGLNGHLVFSALVGAGFGLARQTPRRWLRLVAPLGGYLLATLAHALANSAGIVLFSILLAGFGFAAAADLADIPAEAIWLAAAVTNLLVEGFPYLVLAILLGLSAQWERAVIRTYLADEVGTPAVTAAEYASLARDIPLLSRHAAARADGRRGRAIANAQAELAFRKWHLAREGGDPAADPLVAAWRADIARLREGGGVMHNA